MGGSIFSPLDLFILLAQVPEPLVGSAVKHSTTFILKVSLSKRDANVKFKFVHIPFRYTYQGLIKLSRQSRSLERYVSQPRILSQSP